MTYYALSIQLKLSEGNNAKVTLKLGKQNGS